MRVSSSPERTPRARASLAAPDVAAALPFSLTSAQREVTWSHFDLIGIFIGTLLLTPLQASGEEYGVRGLLFRVVGSWTRSPRAGLIAGVLVTSVLFTAAHGSTDPYINLWYFVLWTCLAIITWRTGGLEIAVVLHAVLNTVAFLGAPLMRIDFGAALADRSAGTGSPTQLIPTLAVIVITAIIWRSTRSTGPALTPPAIATAHGEVPEAGPTRGRSRRA